MVILNSIPIFIICKDRLVCLQKAIESYKKLSTNTDIIIYDNGTTYSPLLEYYLKLERENIATVFVEDKPAKKPKDLNRIGEFIQHQLQHITSPYYIVTDPDIELDAVKPDMLEFYAFILANHNVQCVGPMLRIDDIPNYYPLKDKVQQIHNKDFWSKKPKSMTYNGETFQYQHALIDTTFALFRRNYPFRRLSYGIRTYAPYSARHLDWYIDPNNMTEDQIHYSAAASKDISHWGVLNGGK